MLKSLFIFVLFVSTLLSNTLSTYVGDKACTACHQKELHEWKGSHHDMAMMQADETSVKADFNNTTFLYNGIKTTFYKKDKKFMVQTDGPDGKLHDYEISYTFGIYPLQQYMIKFPDGKVQVLDPTWDNRKKEEGGQRWYHIHKDDNITAGDVLHWSGPNMNWNYMCADCHSTNLKKNYDIKSKSYHTSWDVINVSCEACHGPASNHIAWSKTQDTNLSHKGFTFTFASSTKPWRKRDNSLKKFMQEQELNVCAKCHSRRSYLDDDFKAGDKFSDHYLATQLDPTLYFPDGKIQDEVYVYNSFLQSKMYEEGVTCTDCHNPHSLKRKGVGDKVCYACHTKQHYATTAHHKHKEGNKGASCISCHMPARTYMGVDDRNDHSFRIPRPDISIQIKEVPNACNLCHTDKDAVWATKAMKKWYGNIPVGKQNFAHELKALRDNNASAPKALYTILTSKAPEITKATAIKYLGSYPSKQTYTTTIQMLEKEDPQIRRSALQALESFPPKMRMKKTFDMLNDSSKIVRMEAARQMATFQLGDVNETIQRKLNKVFDEYEQILLFTAERPESQVSLGIYYNNRKMYKKADMAYKEAIRLQPKFVPAYINYSNFLSSQKKSKEAFNILQDGIKNVPDIGILYHALGLWYIRNKKYEKALISFKKALSLNPENARFAYVYAIALGKTSPNDAIKILQKAYLKHTEDQQIIAALTYYYKQIGEIEKSEIYKDKGNEIQKKFNTLR